MASLKAEITVKTERLTSERLAKAFNKWMESYMRNPEQFEREYQTVARFAEERCSGTPTYGDTCAAYLMSLMD